MGKRYVVTGAAGHLGSTIIRLLCDGDCEIYGLLYPPKEGAVEKGNIHYVVGDIRKAENLTPLFAGAAGQEVDVIHAAGLISIAKHVSPELWDVNVNGTQNLVEVCKKQGIHKMVYVSSVHAIPEPAGGGEIQEVEAFSPAWVHGGYAKTKAAATQLVLDAAEKGFPAVAVHPSGILGPYDEGGNHLVQLVADYLNGKMPFSVKGGYDFVDVRDVANGCLLALQRGVAGRSYILSGHYLSINGLLELARKYGGGKPVHSLPVWMARLAAPVAEAVARRAGTRSLFTAYSLYTLTGDGKFSYARAEKELSYCPRPMEETVCDTVEWLRRCG